jgi:hypothetical protein
MQNSICNPSRESQKCQKTNLSNTPTNILTKRLKIYFSLLQDYKKTEKVNLEFVLGVPILIVH